MVNRRFLQLVTFTLVLLSAPRVWALDYGTVKATRDRTDPKKMILSVTWNSVTLSDQQALGIATIDTAQVQQAFVNHVDICVNSDSCAETTTKVRYNIERRPNGQNGNYISQFQVASFVAGGTVLTQDQRDQAIYSYRIDLQITTTDDDNPFLVGQNVFIRLYPDRVGSNGNRDKADVKIVLGSGVKDQVASQGIFSSKGSLTVAWEAPNSVTFVDGTTGSASGVAAALIQNTGGSSTFPALEYRADPAAGAPRTVECQVAFPTDSSCNVTCSGLTAGSLPTFDFETMNERGIRTSINNDVTSRAITFNEVEAESTYGVVLQYLPEGTAFTCLAGTASDATTLVQLTSGKEPKPGDPQCFIATAAYGSTLDAHIDTLRWFRDAYLLKTETGRSLVRAYYRNSPPLADWIAKHDSARAVTRAALWLPVLSIELWRQHGAWLLAGLLPFALVFARRKSRKV